MATTLHKDLTAVELHFSKIERISGSPPSPPTYVGQSLFDYANGILYISAATSSITDWQPIVGSGGGSNSIIDIPTTTYTVLSANNGSTLRMSNAAARAVTLISTPINGFSVNVQDGSGTTGAALSANITVTATGGDTFQNGTSSFVITSDLGAVNFIYSENSSTWIASASYIGTTPSVLSLNNELGSSLTVQTRDTSHLILGVNSITALEISAMLFEIKKTLLLDDVSDSTKQLQIGLSGATTATKSTLNFAQTANRTITMFDATDTIVGKATTDILTNKSFNNTTIMLAANQLNFNNSANTFYTSLKAGANLANLNMTLPTTAPAIGQVLYSTDILGTLGWFTLPSISELQFTTAGAITALPSGTNIVSLEPGVTGPIQGIVAGTLGQTLTIINITGNPITFAYNSGSASLGNRILFPNITDYKLFNLSSIIFTYAYDGLSLQNNWFASTVSSALQIQGSTFGVAPLAGYLGEKIAGTTLTTSIAATPTNLTSIAVSIGTFLLIVNIGFQISAASGFYSMNITITNSGGLYVSGFNLQNGGAIANSPLAPDFRSFTKTIIANAADTYYIRGDSTNTVTNIAIDAFIIRIG